MKTLPTCSLWINVARTDVSFMMQTIPHLVKMCDHPFSERVLAIDTAPLSGEKALRPNIVDLDTLRNSCRELAQRGVVNRVIDINYSDDYRKKAYKKYFGTSRIKNTHNYKGYPVLGSIFCIEEAASDYFLHFDSDMLLYQEPGFSWIEKGIRILKDNPDIMYVRPQAGPQSDSKNIYSRQYNARLDASGFYRLGGFGSRSFLIDRKRFGKLLPMKVLWAKRQGRAKDKLPPKLISLYNDFAGKGLLESWEIMVANAMKEKSFMRADIANNKVWTLHPADHGREFIVALPEIINKIERGRYPPEQAGDYDLRLKYWRCETK